jgi:hypothetical protein
MKRILFFLSLLPYLASAQVAKDTVTVLTPAQITAASPNDTANIYFVIANAWRKANFDSIARYTRNRFQTLTLDSTHIAANGISLQGTELTGTLQVGRGGTNNTSFTSRGVVFAGSTTQLSNSADIVFNTNGELLINAGDSGDYKLQVGGSSFFGTLNVFGTETILDGNNWYLRPTAFNTDFAFNYNGKTGADLIFYSGTTERIRLRDDGRLSVGSGNGPTELLDVNGNARIRAVGTASASNSALYITNTGVLSTNSSDVDKKHNIRALPYGLNTINNLNPVAFNWNDDDSEDIGFVAQDISQHIPETVISNWNGDLIFRTEKLIPVLVKAIQEQQAQIEQLKTRISQLENK